VWRTNSLILSVWWTNSLVAIVDNFRLSFSCLDAIFTYFQVIAQNKSTYAILISSIGGKT
jgi:hypothetical protein